MGLAAIDHQAETRWLATLAEVRRQAARVAEAAGVQVCPREHVHYFLGWDTVLGEPARSKAVRWCLPASAVPKHIQFESCAVLSRAMQQVRQ